jgi:hypothetical protein
MVDVVVIAGAVGFVDGIALVFKETGMTSVAYDLNFLLSGIAALEDYLLSSELYWPLSARPPSGEPPYPKMTLGGILLALARVRDAELSPGERNQFERIEQQLRIMRDRWPVAWEAKARREFSARLRLWRDFLEDYFKDSDNNLDRYTYEVQRRVLLELLAPEIKEVKPEEPVLLQSLDGMLRAVFVRGEFLWDAGLVRAFPEETYWFLWGRPKS